MRYTNYIFSAILFANLFASCAIAKRAHTTGFYGAWPDESKQQSGQDYSSKNLPENVRETQNVADPKTALKGPENTHFDTGQCDLIV